MNGPVPRVGIVGLGLIGGSLARALRAEGHTVVATTRSPEAQDGARALGVDVVADLDDVVAGSDVVVVATALGALPGTVADALARAASASHRPTVTDVGSVKTPIGRAADGPGRELFVGGHPMAGTEHSGWDAGDAAMFRGRTWVVTVDASTVLARWAAVARVALAAGSTVVAVDRDEHDVAVAATSHVPYVLAALAATSVERSAHPPLLRALAAGSFDSLTRVAVGHPTLGAEMAAGNRVAVAAELRSWVEQLSDAADRLEQGHDIEQVFAAGRAARRTLDEAWRDPVAGSVVVDAAGLADLGRAGARIVAVHDVTDAGVAVDVLTPRPEPVA